MNKKKILVFAGSARTDSVNKKLAAVASHVATDAGADVTLINLADYPANVYNGDEEDATGIPDSIRQLKQLMMESDGFIIVSPEYNGHIPPLLSNTFSWTSRAEGDEKPMIAFRGKKAAIMAASPGKFGGIRVIPRLRDILAELGIVVVPGFVTLAGAMEAFDDDGSLNAEITMKAVKRVINTLLQSL